MQAQEIKGGISPFFKGISLSDYMKDMNCPEEQTFVEEESQDTNDLYRHSQPQNSHLMHFAIKQIDEDNYDQSTDHGHLIIQAMQNFDLQKSRIIPVEDTRNRFKNNLGKKGDAYRVRNQSNSPVKEIVSPKKEMFRSLYGHSFGQQPKQQGSQLLSTLGMNNWRGKHKSLNKKQLEQRDKNKRQYQQIIKYQNVINQRLDNKLNSIRIDGVRDKIYERSDKLQQGRLRVEGRG